MKPLKAGDLQHVATFYTVASTDARLAKKTYSLWGERWCQVIRITGKKVEDLQKTHRVEAIKIRIQYEPNPFDDAAGYVSLDTGSGPKQYDIVAIHHYQEATEVEATYQQ